MKTAITLLLIFFSSLLLAQNVDHLLLTKFSKSEIDEMKNNNLKEYDFKYRLLQYWKNVGMSEVEKYDSSLGFSYYMSKHIGKTEINNWDFVSNL